MKTNLLTTTLLLASTALLAQENGNKVFLLDSLHNVTNEKKIFYTRVVENYNTKKDLYTINDYFYPSGKINMTATSKNKDVLRLEGTRIDYYENGHKKKESNYVGNKLSGLQTEWYENNQKKSEKDMTWDDKNKEPKSKILQFWNPKGEQTVTDGNGIVEETGDEFYEKGEIKNGEKQGIWEGKSLKRNYTFTEIYKNGEFKSGISTDSNNNKYPYKTLFEKPEAKRGMMEFYQFVGKNYQMPNAPGLKGKVYVSFVVDKDGSLTDYKLLKDIGYGTGEEAIRVLQKAEKWTPGKMRGVPTKVLYSLPIAIQSPN